MSEQAKRHNTGNKKVVILNAPPNSGKDVGVEYLVEKFKSMGRPSHHQEFKQGLFKATKAAYGVSDREWESMYTRENKERKTSRLVISNKPVSPREALINMSERVMKPLFGKEVFGIMAAEALGEGLNFFSDGGFNEEVLALKREVGESNILLLRISREGCSFQGDSRSYIDPHKYSFRDVSNNESLEDYYTKLEVCVREWLEKVDG